MRLLSWIFESRSARWKFKIILIGGALMRLFLILFLLRLNLWKLTLMSDDPRKFAVVLIVSLLLILLFTVAYEEVYRDSNVKLLDRIIDFLKRSG